MCIVLLPPGDNPIAVNKYVISLEHLPYSPDLVPAHFYLFPLLKSVLKGLRCCDSTDIIKNATEELKRLSQNGIQECFQHLYSPSQK